MKRIYLITTLLLLMVTWGCRSKQELIKEGDTAPIETQLSPEEILYNDMLHNYGAWDTFVAKGRVSLGSLSSPFELRMIQGESIMVSLRPILGIEIARVIITPDSILVCEKTSKLSIAQSLTELREKYPFIPTMENMQSAILGEPFIIGQGVPGKDNFKDFTYEITDECWLMTPRKFPDKGEYLFVFDKDILTATLGKQVGTSRIVTCQYSDTHLTAGRQLPTTIIITAQGSSKSYSATLTFDTTSFNTNTSIDKLPGYNYQQTSITDILKSLLK